VVVLSALLLLVMFRSVVIAIQAAVMNLLSIGGALGVTIAVFQWGWAGSLLGVEKGPIEPWIPVLMFAVVFGLSMDYEVFLVSRIREEWVRYRDATRAVTDGIAFTGRVITAAAAIMICVFLSFMLGDQRAIKEFGFGLAVAVFLDALWFGACCFQPCSSCSDRSPGGCRRGSTSGCRISGSRERRRAPPPRPSRPATKR